jgi:O-antigen ligase
MTDAPPVPVTSGRLALWCGWVLAAIFVLAPPFAWLGSRGFSSLVALAGLLTLPALRVRDEDRPAAIAILTLVVWAVGSSLWSPYVPKKLGETTAVKLILEVVLYAAAISAARAAAPASRVWALRFLSWGMALLGLLLLVEGLTGAALYQALRAAAHNPIRPDLGVRNAARALFVLALFAPSAMVAGVRVGGGLRIGLVMVGLPILAGLVWTSIAFSYDAPIVALAASALAGFAVWTWPRWAPRVLAAVAAAFFLGAPALVWAVRQLGLYDPLQARVSLSWSQRLGYWRHAQDWITDHPLRGWGLDASRMFSPGIHLHPHDAALQIWLELGLIGAVAAAVLWASVLAGLSRDRRDPAVAASVATAFASLTFDAFSFGVWQEWWLGLGALACAACAALMRQPSLAKDSKIAA